MKRTFATAMRVLVLALGAGCLTLAHAQYPAKPVKIVAPFSPGGGTDFIARLIAQKLTEKLGAQFIVENKPGAGGNLGAELAVKSPGSRRARSSSLCTHRCRRKPSRS
jgi:tripartite-type tricarboxylate transporter receptor subunit TctC